jgi:hypothetical protein
MRYFRLAGGGVFRFWHNNSKRLLWSSTTGKLFDVAQRSLSPVVLRALNAGGEK